MTLPRILVVDDQYATQADLREEFCEDCNVAEIQLDTPNDVLLAHKKEGKIAGAVFCSGQKHDSGRITNSVEVVFDMVYSGWPANEGWRWALVLLDVRFDSKPRTPEDEHFGVQILDALVEKFPDTNPGNCEIPVVVLSSKDRVPTSRMANESGARAFEAKKGIEVTIFYQLLDKHGLLEDLEPLGRLRQHLLLGRGLHFLKVLRTAREIARMSPAGNAMILGPQGTGKSTLGRYIHAHSRRNGDFVSYHARQSDLALQYKELFGSWEGSFTGQVTASSPGRVESAHGGTLLIDEIHHLHENTQNELLEFGRLSAENLRIVTRMGSLPSHSAEAQRKALKSVADHNSLNKKTGKIEIDVLLLSATTEPLQDSARREQIPFINPLYTRLALEHFKGPLVFPGLKDRLEDISMLFDKFLYEAARQNNDSFLHKDVRLGALEKLKSHDWPGNIAELQGVAKTVAKNAEGFSEVLERHIEFKKVAISNHRIGIRPDITRSTSHVVSELKFNSYASVSLTELLEILNNVSFTPEDLDIEGFIPKYNQAVSNLKRRIAGAMLEKARNKRTGKVDETTAIRKLWGDYALEQTKITDKLRLLLADPLTNKKPKRGPRDPLVEKLIEHWLKNGNEDQDVQNG